MLACLIDLGVKREFLERSLRFIPDLKIEVSSISHQGIRAKQIRFVTEKIVREKDFLPLISKSRLKPDLKKNAVKIINRIFDAEKKVHGAGHLHLHELADVDTILDVVGVLVALDSLGVERIYSRPLKAGKGLIETVEGKMPAFNLATAELLKGLPVEFLPVPFEFTTPTAAAILGTIAEFTDWLMLNRIENIGLGAGTKTLKNYPNLLRVFLARVDEPLMDECFVIETNIDDQNPQDFEVIMERLYDAGALEVFFTPVIMKNSRPGVVLTVIAGNYNQKIVDTIFRETTTLGVRMDHKKRLILKREIKKVSTPWGDIRIKIFEYDRDKRFSIEYQDLKNLAKKLNCSIIPLRTKIQNFIIKEGFSE